MKLIIQIPCYNEKTTLPVALAALPRHVPGFTEVEWLVIDDGSTDGTAEVAKQCGVDHIITHPQNMGLAAAFSTGINTCVALGADVIVNTDADNQYNAGDIPKLIEPILRGEAEIVVGERPIAKIEYFSPSKKALQKFGSFVIRLVSQTRIPDAPSGFRAISRMAAARLMVYNKYTYTLETIIQAGQCGISIVSVPVSINGYLRPSRLVKSVPSYIKQSIFTVFHIFVVYRPFFFFMALGVFFFLMSFLLGIRFLSFWVADGGAGHIQSLILATIFVIMGGGSCLMAIIGNLLNVNRRLLEDIRARLNLTSNIHVPHLWMRKMEGHEREE